MVTSEVAATIYIMLACFFFAGCGGVAAKLHSSGLRRCCGYEIFAAFLYAACIGTIAALTYYHVYGASGVLLTVAIAGLLGLGGMPLTDFLLACLGAGGISITFSPNSSRQTNGDQNNVHNRLDPPHDGD